MSSLHFRQLIGMCILICLGISKATTQKIRFSNGTSNGTSPHPVNRLQSPPSSYWFQNIKRQGTVPYGEDSPFNTPSSYVIFRNVKDFGAVGDGVADDTDAINIAIKSTEHGLRCGDGCDSSTVTPAIVYFPHGIYLVSSPIIMFYYTQCVGDATNLPTVKGSPSFNGIGIFDSDPYLPGGANWYTNQNNFYRQVRNFIIDMTSMDPTNSFTSGIHWQVAQATSLQNIVFNMVVGEKNNQQQGMFMDNGSGGWMGGLIFNGGNICMFVGNQQFTVRNVTFNNCQTAIFQNWGWVWAYKDLTFNDCDVGIDISNGGETQTVGSVILQDSVFNNVPQAIVTSRSNTTTPISGGTFIADNVDFSGSVQAVSYPNKTSILKGGGIVESYAQGRGYTTYFKSERFGNKICLEPGATGLHIQGELGGPPKPKALLDSTGKIFTVHKPQYETIPYTSFVSVKDYGAKGDGITDDTAAIQAIFNSATLDKIVYFDHGAYLITDTINVPPHIRIVGEIWPMIVAHGSAFNNQNNPKPVWRVGKPGDIGTVEIQELVFETRGPAAGAIIVEWNMAGTTQGAAGMWDVHWRIGGSAGTLMQSNNCTKNPSQEHDPQPKCIGAYLLMHITKTGSVYMENNWGWVADHELDLPGQTQIDIYNGRGILVESQEAVWLLGTSFEHSVLYNYQVANADNVYMSIIQSETPYMQDNPNALAPFTPNASYSDPTFSNCYQTICFKALGLRIFNSNNVLSYGAGLYSFFNDYDQGCLLTESCQEDMVAVDDSSGIYLYALSTKAAQNMVTIDGVAVIPETQNVNTFCETIALFEEP